ncbi:hypothetical protein IWQ62_003271 [Dispira parvispora]|uniref:Uncharacterized protein n=1 Tax=Dispira parvispora TaxID=1520584 RepID=A0A9W8AV49_9FUNG|nr:hypothetical protein IWQ62_003271 [Dispira parvispora]
MDQATANALFDKGGILLFLDAPSQLDIGIDMNLWTIGPRFKGLKLIPPGVHLIYYDRGATRGKELRVGFFYNFQPGEVLVKQWDSVSEQLYPSSAMDPEQRRRYVADIRSFDPCLGAYPLEPPQKQYGAWRKLSGYISADVLNVVLPDGWGFTSADGGPYDEEAVRDHQGVAFTFIDLKHSFPPQSQGSERTMYSRDKSWLLRQLMDQCWRNDYRRILGELQIAYVCLLMGQLYAGFEQWKAILHLVCLSEEAIVDYIDTLYPNFVDVLQNQLSECPEDFFADIIITDNFVAHLLALTKELSLEHSEGEEDESGEYAPVVVEL